jgi:hypothetical protein
MYRPYVVVGTVGVLLFVIGLIPFIRYGVFLILDKNAGSHLQSLILGSVFLIGAFMCLVLAVVADIIRTNRILQEETLEQLKAIRFSSK